MLEELSIRDVGVIDAVELRFAPGLNVLTGETGAGKTMVVAALGLLLGARADTDQVRKGATTAIVEGCLRPPPPGAAEWLDPGDDTLIVAREVAAEGRSRARLGGRLAPASALAATVGAAVEVCDQHESVRMASPVMQRDLLDRWGGSDVATALHAYKDVYGRWSAAAAEQAALQADERAVAREIDRLQFELGEIDEIAPVAGEEAQLDIDLRRLEHAEALISAATKAAGALTDDGGARDGIGTAVAALRGAPDADPELDELHARTDALAAEVQELGLDLGGYAQGLELDPKRLAVLRQRRAGIAGLARKYGHDSTAICAYADTARARLAEVSRGQDRAAALTGELAALATRLDEVAQVLRSVRTVAGQRLAAAVQAHLAELALPRARMAVVVEPGEPAAHGADRVAYRFAADGGEPVLPLGRGASGGERSRVALALRLALADVDSTPVLVFDEVDAGVGGATALAVGRKLARLARGRQVLCVTHLAQLAAFADAHFVVTKQIQGDRAVAGVARLDDQSQRVAELARMLAGTTDSSAAAQTATELLEMAATDAAQP